MFHDVKLLAFPWRRPLAAGWSCPSGCTAAKLILLCGEDGDEDTSHDDVCDNDFCDDDDANNRDFHHHHYHHDVNGDDSNGDGSPL